MGHIKILFNLINSLTGLKELVNFSSLGHLPQQKANQSTKDDQRLCYNRSLLHLHTRRKSAIAVSATCLTCCLWHKYDAIIISW